MGYEMKSIKNFNKIVTQRLGSVLLAAGFLFSIALLSLSESNVFSFPASSFWLSRHTIATNLMAQNTSSPQHPDARNQNLTLERKSVCDFSDPISNVCEINGDIRIHGNSSSILFTASATPMGTYERNESWIIKPHPRKGDAVAMSNVREVYVKTSSTNKNLPTCTLSHTIPAIVFSIAGYMGNIYHDFRDVLIPLFITSHQFQGEVQFLVSDSDMKLWWIAKYKEILNQLSRYEVIEFHKDDRVLCFPQVIVGLRGHGEMSIDPSRAPNGYSMIDFTRLMRRSYALEREHAIRLGSNVNTKPRLMIIARKHTRSFTNVDQIVQVAKELGYEVVVAEAAFSSVAEFANIVNSCDVMVGVHGAGLSNLVFLPVNAIVIQIVPFGGLEVMVRRVFGLPAKDSKLRYLEYTITEEESTLTELYPRDHPVFKDPKQIQKQGWNYLSDIYLRKQNVKLDVVRFRPVLLQALELLHQ